MIHNPNVRKVLLFCGIIAPLLYIFADIFVSTQWAGYSYRDQAISELSAVGAPTRNLWNTILIPFSPLIIAFGFGVLSVAGHRMSMRITGILLTLWGVSGYAWAFFPMNVRGSIGSTTDTMHLVLAGVTVPLMMLFIGFGSGAAGRKFRIYSILTLVMMLIGGTVTALQAPRVAAQLPTPWMGIAERFSVHAPMVWILALAVILLRGFTALTSNEKSSSK